MHRYRLTFDPNAKELAHRDSAGTHVALLEPSAAPRRCRPRGGRNRRARRTRHP